MPAFGYAFAAGLAAALGMALAIVATRGWHGAFTYDSRSGPQKFHTAPTPRIGGVAVYAGLAAAAFAAPPPARGLLLAACAGGALCLIAGLAEDVTKRVGAGPRLAATFAAGFVFCFMTRYSVTSVEVPPLDAVLAVPGASVACTALAMAGFAHATNMIDGFHGLAAGSAILMLAAIAGLAVGAGDGGLAFFCLAFIGVLFGFLFVNFPGGHVFLGDGGAYLAGFVVAAAAVMLPERNPEVSPWASLVALAYPLLELTVASGRKRLRGRSPYAPDRLHLHMLVYRRYGKRLAAAFGDARLANPLAGASMWSGAGACLAAAMLAPPERGWQLGALAVLVALYAAVYRRALGALPKPAAERKTA